MAPRPSASRVLCRRKARREGRSCIVLVSVLSSPQRARVLVWRAVYVRGYLMYICFYFVIHNFQE
ncbi:hypothetical protein E2K99_23470 [Herbaspirillum huttiense]|nr:hypothetical protein E2K99_23470 [Herbaspirillum huttiense]